MTVPSIEPFLPGKKRRHPILVSIEDAAASIDTSRSGMYALIESGKIETRYHGRRRKVVYSSLEEFAATLPSQLEA